MKAEEAIRELEVMAMKATGALATEMKTEHYQAIKSLCQDFGDIPMNPETECIECDWNGFSAGTHREEIWHWFEEEFNIRVYDLMYL